MSWSEVRDLIDVPRTRWDRSPITLPDERSLSVVEGVELHHAAVFLPEDYDPAKRVRSIKRYHVQERKWRDVWYQVLVDPHTGRTYAGRSWTCVASKAVREWLTVCVIGDLRVQQMAPACRQRIAELVARIPSGDIRGHSERDATECPGPDGMALVREIRARGAAMTAATHDAQRASVSDAQEALERGIWDGTRPDAPATRAEAAALALRAARLGRQCGR